MSDLSLSNCLFMGQDLLVTLTQRSIKMYILALNHQRQHQTCLAGMVFFDLRNDGIESNNQRNLQGL